MQTLTSIFDAHKDELASRLKGLSLPRDSKKVEATVADFLNNMFENDGVYRQGLTQSEDYILQSAIQLLQAQQSIATEIIGMASSFNRDPNAITEPLNSYNPSAPIIGAGVGAIAGGFIGTWGAIGGAIAGAAIAVYLSVRRKKQVVSDELEGSSRPINVNAFINIVKKICESVDNLMETYRVQVKRIQNSYEQKETPSLLNECSALFAQIANVYKAVEANKAQIPAKVVSATDMLVESLENYGLTIVDGKVVTEE